MQNIVKPMGSQKKTEKIRAMMENIDNIIRNAFELEKQYEKELEKVHPNYQLSARNLIHYRALRSHNLKELQKGLGNIGLSRLARIQSHVLRSLCTNRTILESFIGKDMHSNRLGFSFKKGNRLLKTNAKKLLGYRSKGYRTRIMVTLPSESSEDYEMIKEMIGSGMNCARINCAHDEKEAWLKMIENVRRASKKLKKNCKIAMDLAGPKIRTGPLVPGPKIRKLKPAKDLRGKVLQPLKVLIGDVIPEKDELPHIPISSDDFKKLKIGDFLSLTDSRNEERIFEIVNDLANGFIALCPKTTYLETGIKLYLQKDSKLEFLTVGEIPPIAVPIILKKSDILKINRQLIPGNSALYDKSGKQISAAHISCTTPAVFDDAKVNEPILFDDGKIEGIIKSINKEFVLIEITHAAKNGSKLRADKGINFPSSILTISGLTEKDKMDLEFVVNNADVINLSFVNCPQDVKELYKELKKLNSQPDLGIILKIETQRGFNHLTEILLEAMQMYPVGVMIARGDLAVETGWKNIGRVQDEILSICQAAHVTDIWATQVLENLAKKGTPSRAEITDVTKAQQADCVMLNKGPFIIESINLLNTIFKDMEPYREKNLTYSPALSKADSKNNN